MSLRPGTHRLRLAGIALYVLFVFTAQFEHHDFVCHLKNPQHCTSCVSSQLGSDPHPLTDPGAVCLNDAGRAFSEPTTETGALLVVRSTGRSPPEPLQTPQI
jgi:hypothetical protein